MKLPSASARALLLASDVAVFVAVADFYAAVGGPIFLEHAPDMR
jgi:hypothetical protein